MKAVFAAVAFAAIAAAASIALAAGYAIGPGDVLDIKVYGEEDLSKKYEVASDGTLRMPWIGAVPVSGLTPRNVEARLEELFGERHLVDPQISVVVEQYRSKKFYVLGHVKTPGAYPLRGETRVLDALSIAGGISPDGDKSFALIRGGNELDTEQVRSLLNEAGHEKDFEDFTRKTGKAIDVVRIDGYRLLDQGDLSLNLTLEHGDILSVPKARYVYFDGEVKKPGPVPYEEGLTLLRGISLAGGVTTSAGNKVIVTRDDDGKNLTISLNLKKLSRNTKADFTLLPDDIVKVKRSLF
ncbi:polysaccharide export protein [bacterium]|nr:polysaccharide export protein [bacterium]